MELYIGVDPSENSTGICMTWYENGEYVAEAYRLVVWKVTPKMRRGEAQVTASGTDFAYILYDRTDPADYTGNSHWYEHYKTLNLLCVTECVKSVIADAASGDVSAVHVCQEGISYGSASHTRSVFDLAGLNYLLRGMVYGMDWNMTIATPGEIKKFATGKGNAAKDSMEAVFRPGHPWCTSLPKYDDLADAYYMALYAKKSWDEEIQVTDLKVR